MYFHLRSTTNNREKSCKLKAIALCEILKCSFTCKIIDLSDFFKILNLKKVENL